MCGSTLRRHDHRVSVVFLLTYEHCVLLKLKNISFIFLCVWFCFGSVVPCRTNDEEKLGDFVHSCVSWMCSILVFAWLPGLHLCDFFSAGLLVIHIFLVQNIFCYGLAFVKNLTVKPFYYD